MLILFLQKLSLILIKDSQSSGTISPLLQPDETWGAMKLHPRNPFWDPDVLQQQSESYGRPMLRLQRMKL
jgi:hypothetical protein